jgi:hypothetical protein
MDLPSVFKIDQTQDQSVSTPCLTVCPYSHWQLAFSKLHHFTIFARLSYQIAWPMTLAPTYEAFKHKTGGMVHAWVGQKLIESNF